DLKRIVDACIKNYLLSLANTDSLKRTRIDLYDDILIVSDTGSGKYRPTLYDFLAHRAVNFFSSTEPDIARPADQFTLSGDAYFKPATEFIKLPINSTDTFSLKYYAIKILQDILAFHIDDDSIITWLDADLKRLQLLKNYSIEPLKDTLYYYALKELEEKCIKHPFSTEVSYAIACVYYTRGNTYQPLLKEDNKWMLKKAFQYCEQAIKRFPGSFGAKNCECLKKDILKKAIDFSVEAFNLPDRPLKALVNYKNLTHVYFRVISLDRRKHRDDIRDLYGEEFAKYIAKLKPVTTWEQSFPSDGDYQLHSSEIKIPALKTGYYIILCSPDKEFKATVNAIAYSYTTITNLSYIGRKDLHENYEFCVMNRENGQELANITGIMWEEQYSYVLQKYVYKRIRDYQSNEQGIITVSPPSDYRYFYMEFRNDADALFTNESFYQNAPYNYRNYEYVTYFFTDRSIYRPGQTIYFKGIVLKPDGDKYKIVPGFSTTVNFNDANYQKVSDLHLTSNEYGTFSGTYTAPQGVMNGMMTIENYYGSTSVSVEEYKRPRFETKFDTIKGSYKLNEKVKVKGYAKSYAGSNIDGADIQYRVTRYTYIPYCWWYWRWWTPPPAGETTICHGTTQSDIKGEFEIEFTAIADPTVDKQWQPTFNYSITADVTDINGETHSASQTVIVGYTAMVINTDIGDAVNKDELKEFQLNTSNLSGTFVEAKGKITISKLKENQKLLCARKWKQPDKYLINKDEYERDYPYEAYKDEDDITKFEKESQVFSSVFFSEKNKKIKLDNINAWKQGKYMLEITSKDIYGEDVNYKHYFTVYSPKETSVAESDIDWFGVINNTGEPGDKAQYIIGSKDKDVKVLYEIEYNEKIQSRQWLTLSDEQRLIEIPIEEKHRGNFSVHFTFVKHNNIFIHDDLVMVPFSNKELDINFATFRNKLYPGQEEEWKITIKGKDGDKVAAEMLATLYDASLDAFKPHYWYFNVYPSYYTQLTWNGFNNFTTTLSTLYENEWNPYFNYNIRYYDELNWFGFYYGYYGRYRYYYDGFALGGARGDVVLEESEKS
ncbi:MAG: hypothetical protein HY738_15930, partial [Bacteroidia bacterium]|nr:hypothetical protein [Bacteroidia bacterium]